MPPRVSASTCIIFRTIWKTILFPKQLEEGVKRIVQHMRYVQDIVWFVRHREEERKNRVKHNTNKVKQPGPEVVQLFHANSTEHGIYLAYEC